MRGGRGAGGFWWVGERWRGVMGCEKNGLGRKGLGGNGASRLKDERRLNAREEEEVSVY